MAWLSLDEGDNDPAHFLAYFIAATQTVHQDIGQSVVAASQSSQPPAIQALLTTLINEIAAMPERFTLVLDDYHLITAQPIHDGLAFLPDHLPPQMHLVIATRADPPLPLTRLRARGQL
ncbi:MAG: LuxR family transcriptional regulator, partial [Anaerolineae bacterium]|nr:LuxR family transcriptional regulator [Anaerolineae bacterium]